ncbi:MAG: hypothetical protein V7752_18405 [Halopseudomonas sp.]
MQQLIRLAGNVAAVVGVLCCAIAVLSRISGAYYLPGGSIEAMTVFTLGVGMMVFACLAKLEQILHRDIG